MRIIKKSAPDVWLLVKVPKITNAKSDRDVTERMLRECVRDHHFGGETAVVRNLRMIEVIALKAAGVAK